MRSNPRHPLSRFPDNRALRNGFTVIELFVTMTIIGLLMAILIPAVVSIRESARRMQCQNNLKQLILAASEYESTFAAFPGAESLRHKLLPYLDRRDLWEVFLSLRTLPTEAAKEAVLRELGMKRVAVYLCPAESAPETIEGVGVAASYVGCYGTGLIRNGFDGFFTAGDLRTLNDKALIRPADITNGLSNTVAFSEWLHNDTTYDRLRVRWLTARDFIGPNEYEAFATYCESIPPDPFSSGWRGAGAYRGVPWTIGGCGSSIYNHMLPPNRPSCDNRGHVASGIHTAGSMHFSGANVAFGDGHVANVGTDVDRRVWRSMGSRLGPDLNP